MNAQREMPRYKCHKQVWALRIKELIHHPNPDNTGRSAASSYGATIMPVDDGYAPFEVSADYVSKHRPEVGGYFVVYDDGYKSYSPAKAFQDGYAPIVPQPTMSEGLLPYQRRVVDEKAELDDRLQKLVAFVGAETFAALPREERFRLERQRYAMEELSKILDERIAAFGVT